MSKYKLVTKCRCCGGVDLVPYINLTDQPPANSYHAAGEDVEKFPLCAMLCKTCYHSMLSVVVDPDLLFRNYAYVSGTSNTLLEYFDWFETQPDLVFANTHGKKVLDIACNDGSQLDVFKKRGWSTYGVDPALNLVKLAAAKGHTVIPEYWNIETAASLDTTFDAIIAQNVFAHTDNILEFLIACKMVMDNNTVLYIQTSQSDMILRNEFDTMYHEHVSFFNTNSMNVICKRAGLKLRNVSKNPIHGTSYIFVISLGNVGMSPHNVEYTIEKERLSGLYNLDTYDNFRRNATRVVNSLNYAIDKVTKEGYISIGVGAAAKGMTVINFANLELNCILDENPLKIGMLTPGMNIPIYDFDHLSTIPNDTKIAFLLTAWNFEKELREKIKKYRNNPDDVFIKYFPTVTTTS